MTTLTQITGAVLIVLGVIGYVGGDPHWTALLPVLLGVAVLAAGIVARVVDAHQHAIHAALVLVLVGFLASLRQVGKLVTDEATLGPVMGTIVGVVCAVYIALGVRSFVAARKAREAD